VACTARLLVDVGDHAYQCAHDTIREVIEADASAPQRALLHRRLARALERLPGPARAGRAAELAGHFQAADDGARALPYLLQAGDQAEYVFAHGTAERHYRAALALALDLGDEGRRGQALEKLGGVLRIAGRYSEALAVLEDAAALYARRGDPEGAGRVVAHIGRIHATQGTTERGIARVQALLASAPRGSRYGDRLPHAHCELHVVLSYLLFAAGQYRPSLAAAARAADLARVLPDDALMAEAELRRGTALDVLGDAAGLAVLEAAIPLAEASGASETLDRLLTNIAATYSDRGAMERSRVYAERALEVAERRGDPARIGFALTNVGETSLHLGDWAQARLHLERAAALLRAVGASWYLAYAHLHLGRLCLDEGRWPEATRHLEECCAIATAGNDLQALPAALHILAEQDILEGHPSTACERVTAALARADARNLAWLQPMRAWALLEMGETDAAHETIAVAISDLAEQGQGAWIGPAYRVAGMVGARQSRWDDATSAFEEALSRARCLRAPFEEARALQAYGLMLARRHEIDEARRCLLDALAIVQQLGARPDRERIEETLAHL